MPTKISTARSREPARARGPAGASWHVCLITTGHPSTNPRLVKEADTLVAAGHRVSVVACRFLDWAVRADRSFANRSWWPPIWVDFGAAATPIPRIWRSARRRAARELVSRFGIEPAAVGPWALHYVIPELTRRGKRVAADLYVAHNLGALPAAAAAASSRGVPFGFDAEDFHRGEIDAGDPASPEGRLVRWAEEEFIPRCAYVTAASDGIAQAYAEALAMRRPETVLNVFSLADREQCLGEEEVRAEKAEGVTSLYWFSQTIGPGRGLGDALRALPGLDDAIHLHLRGAWAPGYERVFLEEARGLGVDHRVRVLSPGPPHRMIPLAACHDVGLALEPGSSPNRNLCVTNKLFTYMSAGLPAVATATAGQRGIAERVPEAVRLVPPGDPGALAGAVNSLVGAGGSARRAAALAAEREFNWERESRRLLALWQGVLGANGP